ncbi:BREX-6 system adenine-specific DNA-methyltransferase PglX [Bremerella sp.]|uniref:BREX-6 system adenine-specific DNA-methyltransferase PglX n=1 Tax=Bremerella sp. TaxID=2795602 RepID=UPI0039187504
MVMTPEAKSQLSKTIRALRTRLLDDFKSSNDSTYKYSIRRIDKANLSEADATRRGRIEEWIAEQVRGEAGKKKKRTGEDFRRDLEKQAAYTLLNRMLILRLMEAMELRGGDLVAKGWESDAYKSFRYFAQEIVHGEESEGYAFLLQMVFDDLAIDMPGLYGDAGMSDLIPVPTKTLRAVIDAFSDPKLESCWTDDMTLGWVYQYWNDPEREALDAKINDGGKIEPHEIASKTQMFTDRYMVDWLLHNSLGPMWLAMCKKHGWTPLARSSGTLDALEERRADWRARRDSGEVELTELMPLHTDLERRWAYYVPQETPDDAVEHASETVRELKILDPAVGSGHFLVVAFDLLFALYQEEAQHRGEQDDDRWSAQAIVESILENNLHGIDLDPRAVQIAAAALWIKAKSTCTEAHPSRLNLVASNLGIARLPDNDPALVELRRTVENETGIPENLTNQIIEALRGADHLGSLLKIDVEIEKAIDEFKLDLEWEGNVKQLKMFPDGHFEQQDIPFPKEKTSTSLLATIERFLARHSSANELGLRLRGKQLAMGVQFTRMNVPGYYDLVVGNPPYQRSSGLRNPAYTNANYKKSKADLYAVFIERSLELTKEHGTTALLTMRGWMFIKEYKKLREHVVTTYHIKSIADFDRGAFEEILDEKVSVSVVTISKLPPESVFTRIVQPTELNDRTRDSARTARKRAATLVQKRTFHLPQSQFSSIPLTPFIYWWTKDEIEKYQNSKLLGEETPVRTGLASSGGERFSRCVWELPYARIHASRATRFDVRECRKLEGWVPVVKGAKGKEWIEPLLNVVNWKWNGLECKLSHEGASGGRVVGEEWYGTCGLSYPKIASTFSSRIHRYFSIFGDAASTVFPTHPANGLCLLNSADARRIVGDFNPSLNFQTCDVERLPIKEFPFATELISRLDQAFGEHERKRETSFEFESPGPSPWRSATRNAQAIVDGDSSDFEKFDGLELQSPSDSDFLSYAMGVVLGRFSENSESSSGQSFSYENAVPEGILFIDRSLDDMDYRDSLGHSNAIPLRKAWDEFGSHVKSDRSLRNWLANKFFSDVHKDMYENRPIHWPLSSRSKTFVAWINIHRWNSNTLRSLLADHLHGNALPRIDGELDDLRKARAEGAKGSDARFLQVQKWKEELDEFITLVKECAEKGPPPTDDKCPKREVDARYDPDLDDGVMINSAALWPLLEPQWKDPKKWWKQLALANPKGNKDYDWSHLAMRYFPTRVDAKCQEDPSLGVAHGCFWKYHPANAWAWELRLQDEIGPDFRIKEAPYRGDGGDQQHREAYLRDHPLEAIAAIEKEVHRRRKNAEGKILEEMAILEPGIWSAEPEACWDMETRIIKKQEFGFRLIAPDEQEARAKLLDETPQKKTGREKLLRGRGGATDYLAGWEEAVQDS